MFSSKFGRFGAHNHSFWMVCEVSELKSSPFKSFPCYFAATDTLTAGCVADSQHDHTDHALVPLPPVPPAPGQWAQCYCFTFLNVEGFCSKFLKNSKIPLKKHIFIQKSSKFSQKPLKFSAYGALKMGVKIHVSSMMCFSVWTRHNFEGEQQ